MAIKFTAEMAAKLVEAAKDFLPALYDRWLDEKEYEDFKDYGDVIKTRVAEVLNQDPANDLKPTKRPFGFDLTVDISKDAVPYVRTYRITVNSTRITFGLKK